MGTRNFWKSADVAPPFAPGHGYRDIFGGDSPAPPPPPDYAPMAAASDKAAQLGYDLGKEQLAETQRQYNINRGVSDRVANSQIGLMDQAKAQGDDYYNYMVQNQRPVETALNREAMTDTTAQDAADRAKIQGLYDTGIAGAEQGRQGIMGRYTANEAQDAQERAQMLATRTGGADQAAQMQAQMYGLSGSNAAANAAQRGQMLDLSGQNDVANAAQRQQMLDLRNQGYSQADAVRAAMANRYQSNDALNTQEGALISGGDTGIYNARQGDIEAGVGRAAADARTGQAATTNQMIRQAMRYGYSPNKLAAMAGSQGLGQGSQIAAASNAARQQGIDANRGYLQQGYNLRNAATDQYMGYAGADRNAIMQNYEGQAGAVGANADQRNAAFAQRYGALGTAYDQGNAAYQQQYGAMDANRTGYLQDADLRANAMGAAYDQRNATNNAMLQALTNNRQMGLDQSQMGIQGAMNNRNLGLQDRALTWGKKLDVAGLYRGMPGASQGAYGVATNAGNSAVANTMQPGGQLLTGMAQGAGQQQTGMGQQITGLGQILNANTSYNNMVAGLQGANAQADASGMAGLGNLVGTVGAAGIKAGWFSDRRLKENIVLVGKDDPTGLNLYEFNYINTPTMRFRGVMADEVREVMPEAVLRVGGYDQVNYSMLGFDMVEV